MENNNKIHFIELYNQIKDEKLAEDFFISSNDMSFNSSLAILTQLAWNACINQSSLENVDKILAKYARAKLDNPKEDITTLHKIAQLKWTNYPEDNQFIVFVEVVENNNHYSLNTYFQTTPINFNVEEEPFFSYINQEVIQDVIKNTSPENRDSQIEQIIQVYNSKEPRPLANYLKGLKISIVTPLTKKELEDLYNMVIMKMTLAKKREYIDYYLSRHLYLTRYCKQTSDDFNNPKIFTGSIQELIIALLTAVYKNLGVETLKYKVKNFQEEASSLAQSFINDKENFAKLVAKHIDSELFTFVAQTIEKLNIPKDSYEETLTNMLAWTLMLEISHIQVCNTLDKSAKELAKLILEKRKEKATAKIAAKVETYDFDKKNLNILTLHILLKGFRQSVDILVPEDMTFDKLSEFIVKYFDHDSYHLYRFTLANGVALVSELEELSNSYKKYAHKSYLGHHLTKGAQFTYLYDYGDQFEHIITVKDICQTSYQGGFPRVI